VARVVAASLVRVWRTYWPCRRLVTRPGIAEDGGVGGRRGQADPQHAGNLGRRVLVGPLRREEVRDVSVSGHQLQKVARLYREADPAGRAESSERAPRLLGHLGDDRELAAGAGRSEPRSSKVIDTEPQSSHAYNHPSLDTVDEPGAPVVRPGARPCQGVSIVAERACGRPVLRLTLCPSA
jgi:hypothetical protein